MAQLHPESVGPVNIPASLDWAGRRALEIDWYRNNVRTDATAQDPVGGLFQFSIADGYAEYLVVEKDPLTLAHIDIGDSWHAPDYVIRGVEIDDLVEQWERAQALRRRHEELTGEAAPS